MRSAIAARVGARGTDPFSLLWELGRDCVGALQFLPASEDPVWHTRSEGELLSEGQIEKLLVSLSTSPLGLSRDTAFRISVAGAQEKTALLRTGNGWLLPSGTTPSTHIIKPAIVKRGAVDLNNSVENEYVCMSIAAAIGLITANVTMEQFGEVKTLVVERFDRVWSDGTLLRLPQEDVCQALSVPSFRKYEADGGPEMVKVLDLLLESDLAEDDRKRFFRACFMFWVLGATDGHAKNFSLALGPQGGFRLAPLYDLMSLQSNVDAHLVDRNDYRVAMAVGTNGHYRVEEIMPRHFVQTAVNAGINGDTAELWMKGVAREIPVAIERLRNQVGDSVPEKLLDSIAHGALRRVGLLA